MKTNIATTRDQSARLLQCGVPAESADMCLSTRTRRSDGSFIAKKHQTTNLWVGYPCWRTTSGDEELDNVPAFSLGALLGLFPKEMGIAVGAYPGSDKYTCFTLIDPNVEPIVADTAVEAAVQMIEQLTANGYKLNGIEEGGEENEH